jgi:hypothetical protein
VLQVRQIEQIEERLPLFFQGKWQPDAAEWRMIQRHDRLLAAEEQAEQPQQA